MFTFFRLKGNKNTLVSNSVLELGHNSYENQWLSSQEFFEPVVKPLVIGSLKSSTVGVFTPLILASVMNEGLFLLFLPPWSWFICTPFGLDHLEEHFVYPDQKSLCLEALRANIGWFKCHVSKNHACFLGDYVPWQCIAQGLSHSKHSVNMCGMAVGW